MSWFSGYSHGNLLYFTIWCVVLSLWDLSPCVLLTWMVCGKVPLTRLFHESHTVRGNKKKHFSFFLVLWVWVRFQLYFGSNHQSILSLGIFNIWRAPCGNHPICAHIPYFGDLPKGQNPGGDLKISVIFTNLGDIASEPVKVGSSFSFYNFPSKNNFDPRRS